jgi:hypothetical protein
MAHMQHKTVQEVGLEGKRKMGRNAFMELSPSSENNSN